MTEIEYRLLGVISIFMLWLGFIALLKLWPGNISMSVSQHAAQTKNSHLFLIAVTTVPLALFCVFSVKWLIPAIDLGQLFYVILILTVVSQIAAVIIPEVGVRRRSAHRIIAYSAGTMWLIMLIVILLTGDISRGLQVVLALTIVAMSSIIAILTFSKKAYENHHLIYQLGYFALCDLALLSIIFAG